ncbi:hypothetical protein GCM10027168_50870 [Streptomyces capparidis]
MTSHHRSTPARRGPDPAEDDLRHALERAARRHEPAPAPVADIVRAGRARRARNRALVAAAVCAVVAVGVGTTVLGAAGPQGTQPSGSTRTAAPASPPRTPPSAVTSTGVASGTMDGLSWSVRLEYHPRLPADYHEERGPQARGLLCERILIGGTRVDAEGGPWSGCTPVAGPRDVVPQAGVHVVDEPGAARSRVLAAQPGPDVARAVITYAGGERRTAEVAAVPGTAFRGYAFPVRKGQYIEAVEEYDAHGALLSRETQLS